MSIKVLHVDDEPSLLELSKEFLEMDGDITVELMEDPVHAIECGAIDSIDVIVSDYQMPRMTGLELLENVRRTWPDVPFILYTGQGREEIAIRALELGADSYMQKGGDPVSQYTELKHKVRQLYRRLEAERKVHEANRRFKNIFDNSQDAMFIIDSSNGRIININPQAVRMFGRPEESLIGLAPWDLSPTDLPGNDETMARYHISSSINGPVTFEWVHTRSFGNGFPVIVTLTPNDPDGRFLHCNIRDMTERTRIKSELISTRNQMSTLLDSYNDMVIVTDEDFVIEAINERVIDTLSVRRHEVVGRTLENIIDRATALEMSNLHEGGRPRRVRLDMGCGGMDLEVVMRCYDDHRGMHRLLVLKDITEDLRKDSTIETMVARGEMLERIVENSQIAAFQIRRSDHSILYLSENISQFGISPERLVSDSFGIIGIIDQIPRGGGMVDFCHRMSGGRCLEISLWPEVTVDGEDSVAGTMYDVTDRMHTLEALEKAHTQLSLLTSVSRHDYFNLLSTIDGYNGIASSSDDIGSMREALESQKGAIIRMGNELRINRRLYSINWDEPKWVDIAEIVSGIEIPERRDVRLIDETEGLELFTAPMISKVIANIVDNSLEHGGDVNEIRIHYDVTDELRLFIDDDGRGISKDIGDAIFKKGYGDRNGFGLYLSKSILMTAGFDITEEGVNGARFVIHVPWGRFRTRSA